MNVSTRTRLFAAGAIAAAIAAGAAVAQTAPPATPAVPPAGPQAGPGAMPGPMMGHHGMQHGQHGQREHRGDGMMMRFDTNGDGKISRAEFEAGQRAMAERMNKAFDAADTDRDGALSVEGRRAFRESMHAQMMSREGGPRRLEQRGPGRQPAAPAKPGTSTTPGA